MVYEYYELRIRDTPHPFPFALEPAGRFVPVLSKRTRLATKRNPALRETDDPCLPAGRHAYPSPFLVDV